MVEVVCSLTAQAGDAAGEERALVWRLVDELLLFEFRNARDLARAEAIWEQLVTRVPGQTAAVLCDIHFACHGGAEDDTVSVHGARH